MKCLNVLAFVLVVIGALNWGLWGFWQFDFVAWLFHGQTSWLSRLVYSLVGLSGLWMLRVLPQCRHLCCGPTCCCKGQKTDKGSKGGGCCR